MLVHEILIESHKLHGLTNEESVYFSKVVALLSKTLKIPPSIKIDVAFKPNMKFDANQSGLTIPNPKNKNHIFVFIAPGLSNGERVMTVAHEFLHVEHLVSGRMSIDVVDGKYIVTWEGQEVEMKYSSSNPWEIDAHQKDVALGKQMLSAVGNLLQ